MDLLKNLKLERDLDKQYKNIEKIYAKYSKDKSEKKNIEAFVQNIREWVSNCSNFLFDEARKCDRKSGSKQDLCTLGSQFQGVSISALNYINSSDNKNIQSKFLEQMENLIQKIDQMLKKKFSPIARLSSSKVRKKFEMISNKLKEIHEELKSDILKA